MAPPFSLISAFSLLLLLLFDSAVSEVVLEEGYTVSTVLDGNKLHVNPHSILPLSGSSDLIILDSAGSSFYTVSLSEAKENVVKWLAGKGTGYSDGDLASAKFEKPRSFAIDLSGNVYVADRGNFAIRKISKSGVSTIAGGASTIPGHADGPGRAATFSSDFELAFIPEKCALLICDHGHQLIREIKLKPQDCSKGSEPVSSASAWTWALALGVSCLAGLVIGFAVRPFITSYETPNPFRSYETWKSYLTSLGRQVLMLYSDTKNAVVSSSQYTGLRSFSMLIVSHLTLMFRINKSAKSPTVYQKPVSLLDFDVLGSKEEGSNKFDEQLKDLVTFDGGAKIDGHENGCDAVDGYRRIDGMIEANMLGFVEQAKKAPLEESLISSSGLVKRR